MCGGRMISCDKFSVGNGSPWQVWNDKWPVWQVLWQMSEFHTQKIGTKRPKHQSSSTAGDVHVHILTNTPLIFFPKYWPYWEVKIKNAGIDFLLSFMNFFPVLRHSVFFIFWLTSGTVCHVSLLSLCSGVSPLTLIQRDRRYREQEQSSV